MFRSASSNQIVNGRDYVLPNHRRYTPHAEVAAIALLARSPATRIPIWV